MKSVKLGLAVTLVLAALPLVSFAQEAEGVEEAESPFSWSVAVTSDYVFRGISQTDEGPALQADLTYTVPSGFYVGAWGSNVDLGDGGPSMEVDTFIGYNTDLGDEFVNLDVKLNRYNYLGGNGSDLAYNELNGVMTFGGVVSVAASYTNDVWASGEDGWYLGAGLSLDLGNDYSLAANVGQNLFDSSVARDYVDYGVSVSKAWGDFSASLGYVGTSSDGQDYIGETAEDRAVLTLTYAR